MSLERQILTHAKQRGVLIATAESCTGGMVAARLTDPAGASAIFDRGFVTYTNAAKIEQLGVSPDTLTQHGAVSEEVAQAMATGARQASTAQIAVAITGIAGPGGSDHKPEGRVCFGLATPTSTHTETVEFNALGRKQVREAATEHALRLILSAL
ncbi:MAG: CinA family protein [Paracoccaceae bacterium]